MPALVDLMTASPLMSAPPKPTVFIDSPADGARVPVGQVAVWGRAAAGATPSGPTRLTYVVDVSGSTDARATSGDCDGDGALRLPGDDFNGDGKAGKVLDCEISGVLALNGTLVGRTDVTVGLVAFARTGVVADLAPASGEQQTTTPVADTNSNGTPDIAEVARSLTRVKVGKFGAKTLKDGTNFTAALNSLVQANRTATEPSRVAYFLSDGKGTVTDSAIAAAVRAKIVVHTFAIGPGADRCGSKSRLSKIATATGGTCTTVADPTQLRALLDQPAGVDRVDVARDGQPPVQASLDSLGNWTATVGGIVAGPNPITATLYTTDGRQVSTSITIVGVAPADAVEDVATTTEDTYVDIDVLGNDIGELDRSSLTITTPAALGTAEIGTDHTIRYTPNPNLSGTDTFGYRVCDTDGACDTAAVTVTVIAVNDPPTAADDTATTPANTPILIPVLANDTDVDGDPLAVTDPGDPDHGTTTVVDAAIRYSPDEGYAGSDTFTYTVADADGATDTATVTVTVDPPPNQPPDAQDDSATTGVGTPVVVDVLANDSDPDSDTLTVATVDDPASGSAGTDGTHIQYTPDPGFSGTDSFTYTVADGHGGTDTATVTVTVGQANQPPTAVDDEVNAVSRPAGIITTVAGTGVAGYSGDGGPAVQAQLNGPTLAVDDGGNVYISDFYNSRVRILRPDGVIETLAGNGTPGFSGDGGPAVLAQLTRPDSVAVGPDGSIFVAEVSAHRIRRIDPSGIISTYAGTGVDGSGGDGGPATAAQISIRTSSHLFATRGGDLYLADSDARRIRRVDAAGIIHTVAGDGTDGFSPDGTPATKIGLVDGLAVDGSGTVFFTDYHRHYIRKIDSSGLVWTVAGNGQAGSTGDGGPALQATVSNPAHIDFDSHGALYVADTGACRVRRIGPDGIIETVIGNGLCAHSGDGGIATDAGLPHPYGIAVSTTGAVYVTEDHRVRVSTPFEPNTRISLAVLNNDTDPEADPLTLTDVTLASKGRVEIAGQSLVYTPSAGAEGDDSFTYTIEDGHGGTDTATVTIHLTLEPNRAPDAADDGANTDEDIPIQADVLANDTDPDGNLNPASLAVVAGPTLPGARSVAFFGRILYTPPPDASGTDTITYRVCDIIACDTATLTITIAPVNDPPVAVDDTATLTTSMESQRQVFYLASRGELPDDSCPRWEQTYLPGTLNDGVLTLRTTSHSELSSYGHSGNNLALPDTITARASVMVGDGSTSHTARAQAGIRIDLGGHEGAYLWIGRDEVFLLESNMTRGPAALVDTTSEFHDYRLIVGPHGLVQAYYDGELLLEGATFIDAATYEATPHVVFGDLTNIASGTSMWRSMSHNAYAGSSTCPVLAIEPLGNDTDPELDTLTVQSITQPAHGSASTDGVRVGYTPDEGYAGEDQLAYMVSDGHGGSDTATIHVYTTAQRDVLYTTTADFATGDLFNAASTSTPDTLMILASTPGSENHPFNQWTPEPLEGINDTPVWVLSADNTSVSQTTNAFPSIFVSPGNSGVSSFTITPTGSDDDYVGFVMGFERGDSTNPNADYLLLDWKKNNQNENGFVCDPVYVLGARGMALSRITGVPAEVELWGHRDFACSTGVVAELRRATTLASTGWTSGFAHAFDVCHTSDRLRVLVDGQTQFDISPADVGLARFPDNSFGFYTFSQPATFRWVERAPGEISCGAPQGEWRVVQDGGLGAEWGQIAWNSEPEGSIPPGADIVVEARVADTRDALTSQDYQPVQNGGAFDLPGRFIEVRTSLRPDSQGTSPVLSDLRITATNIVNPPPNARNDTATTDEDLSVAIPVLDNDTDADDNLDPASLSIRTAPAAGTAAVAGDKIVYTPARDFHGTDVLAYQVCDAVGQCDNAGITVEVQPVNDSPVAVADMASTGAGLGVVADVVTNDSDVDGDPLVVSEVSDPEHGSATADGGTVTYTPDEGFLGVDTVTYTISDGHGGTASATLTVHVLLQPNGLPVANPDSATTLVGTAAAVAVLANDTDPDGDPLTLVSVTAAAHGSTVAGPAGVTYVPVAGFAGTDSFIYTITDGKGAIASATVTVTVAAPNAAPVAVDDDYRTQVGAVLVVEAPGVVGNDTDLDGDALTVTVTRGPAYGELTVGTDGAFVYVPPDQARPQQGSDFYTQDFEYTTTDPAGHVSAPATVTVSVYTPPGPAPAVGNVAPADGAAVTAPTPIEATITAPASHTIESWTVSIVGVDGGSPRILASGSGSPPAALATLDPTTLANGIYQLTVSATASNGAESGAVHSVVVEGGLKPGRVSMQFEDLAATVAGFRMRVLRSYDSFEGRTGDFGVGWSVDVADMRVSTNRTLGEGTWQRELVPMGFIGSKVQFKRQGASYVTVTYPLGRTETFDFKPADGTTFFDGGQSLAPPIFTPRDGATSTLEDADSPDLRWENARMVYGGMFDRGGAVYNPQRFKLTTRDGTVIVLNRSSGVESITDVYGNALTVSADGVRSTSGPEIRFVRDARGRIDQVTGPAGETVRYTYSSAGDLVEVVDQTGQPTHYSYDSDHNLTGISDASGHPQRTMRYDAEGRLESVTDALGNTVTLGVDIDARTEVLTDPTGLLTTITRVDERGNPISVKQVHDGRTDETEYEYDPRFDLPTRVVDAMGGETRVSYTSAGNVSTVTDDAGNTTTYRYNPAGELETAEDPEGNTPVRLTYDKFGKVDRLDRTDRTFEDYTYDSRGLLTAIEDRNGTTTFRYDTLGNLVERTGPTGQTSRIDRDGAGRVVRLRDAAGAVTTYERDDSGRVTEIVDAGGRHRNYTYGTFGNLITVTDATGAESRYEYDAADQLVRAIDRNGVIATFRYDAAGRAVKTSLSTGETTTVAYDGLGRARTLTNESGSITREYDPLGRTLREHFEPADGTGLAPTDARNEYDALGLRRHYEGTGGAVDYDYDNLGRLETLSAGADTYRLTYDSMSRMATLTRPGGLQDVLSYDPTGRIESRVTRVGAAALVGSSYTYDPLGRVDARTDGSGTTVYDYDPASRVTDVTLPDSTHVGYSYDPLGNRQTASTAPSGPYTYEGDHRLRSDGAATYDWDAEGRLRKRTVATTGEETLYDWNGRGQLVAVHQPDGETISYRYDPIGRRIETNAAGDITRFAYDGANVVAELDAANQVTAAYTHMLGVDQPIAMTQAGSTAQLLANGQGDIVAVAEADGTVNTTYSYDTFGQVTQNGESQNAFTFRSREFDQDTGLYYMRARWYDPAIGRFISEDPVSHLNAYPYAGNDPVNKSDPSGATTMVDYSTLVQYQAETAAELAKFNKCLCAYAFGSVIDALGGIGTGPDGKDGSLAAMRDVKIPGTGVAGDLGAGNFGEAAINSASGLVDYLDEPRAVQKPVEVISMSVYSKETLVMWPGGFSYSRATQSRFTQQTIWLRGPERSPVPPGLVKFSNGVSWFMTGKTVSEVFTDCNIGAKAPGGGGGGSW
ncbi:MAG: Ig-like domain-containing protein [Acidimicrobiia bacterium]